MAIFHSQPTVDMFEVLLHRASADPQNHGDFWIRLALDNPPENLCFTTAEPKVTKLERSIVQRGFFQEKQRMLVLAEQPRREGASCPVDTQWATWSM